MLSVYTDVGFVCQTNSLGCRSNLDVDAPAVRETRHTCSGTQNVLAAPVFSDLGKEKMFSMSL